MPDTFEQRLTASLSHLADSAGEPVRVRPRGPRFAVPIGVVAVAMTLVGVFLVGDLLRADDTKPVVPLTAEEFRAKANAVCESVLVEVRQVAAEEFEDRRDQSAAPGTEQDQERFDGALDYIGKVAALNLKMVAGLRPLVPPVEMRQDFEEFLDLVERASSRIAADPAVVMDPAWEGAPGATARTKRLGIQTCNLETENDRTAAP